MKYTFFCLFILTVFTATGHAGMENKHSGNDVIVLAAPSVADIMDDEYDSEIFEDIIQFDIEYANAIHGRDTVFILVDEETRPYFQGKVPDGILISSTPLHVWMRDYTTINPYRPVQFRYTPASFDADQDEADRIQYEFNSLFSRVGIRYPKALFQNRHLKLDGGNIVDNYAGRVVTTERFMQDNKLSKHQAVNILKRELQAFEVAVIPADDPVLAHSDGMVMFSDTDTLFLNKYDEPFRSQTLKELRRAFPGIKLIEVPVNWDEEDPESACGVNLNATVTENYIYMPHFGDLNSDEVLKKIQENTSKTVIPVNANTVCKLGGSVRCLSWQQSGAMGEKLISAIKNIEN